VTRLAVDLISPEMKKDKIEIEDNSLSPVRKTKSIRISYYVAEGIVVAKMDLDNFSLFCGGDFCGR
jgi:hypothetical protein